MTKRNGPGSPLGGKPGPGSRTSRDSDATQPISPDLSPARRTPVTPLYLALACAFEQRRLALGIPQDKFAELAGLPERYFAKAFICPDSAAGRQASWPLIQATADTLYPDGFDLRILARSGPALSALSHQYFLRFDKTFADARTRREQLRAWGRRGGLTHSIDTMKRLGRRGARERNRKLSREKRAELARRASQARWGNEPKNGQRQ